MGGDGRVDIPYEGPEIIFPIMTATSFPHRSHRGTCWQNHGFPWNQLSINSNTCIQVFTGLSPWKDLCCCLLKKNFCQGGTSWFCLPNWREHSWKNMLKNKKKMIEKTQPVLNFVHFLFFFSILPTNFTVNLSELASPLNDSIMRKVFCMNLRSSLSNQINKFCTNWFFLKMQFIGGSKRLYRLHCLFQLLKIKNRLNSNENEASSCHLPYLLNSLPPQFPLLVFSFLVPCL